MEGRYKKHGWFLESERHNLARQGIKTKIGRGIGKGIFNFIDTAKEGLTQDAPVDDDGNLIYEPVTVSGIEEKEPDVMSDVDSVIEAESKEEIESPEPIMSLPEEQTLPEYSSNADNEVREIEDAIEGKIIGSSWFDKAKNYITAKLKDLPKSISTNNPEVLSKNVGELEAHKELLNDKIGLIEETKRKVMSSKYREEAGMEKQIENAEKLNKYIEKLKGEMSNIDYKVATGKKHLQHIQSLPIEMRKSESGSGFFSGIFPSFKEMINPFSGLEAEKKSSNRFKASEVREKSIYSSVFPSFGELLHPEKIKR